jgi:hypothetical protein
MEIPSFSTKKELFDFLIKNKTALEAQKKAQIKQADVITFPVSIASIQIDTNKAEGQKQDPNILLATIVINTTNLMDSHSDVHMPGIWTKSLKENKMLMHMQEHQMAFDHIISDGADLKGYTKNYSWSELGYDFNGITEALVFESKIRKDRNPFMFDQYQKGFVRNHSVGMQYIKIVLCINDEDAGAEYEAWQKYYPEVSNKEYADEKGYFWAVKEAKVIEGSSVVRGSNWATPTISISEGKNQPVETTGKDEPVNSTLKTIANKTISFRKLTVCDSCGTMFDSWGMMPDDDNMIDCPKCGGRTTKENSGQSNKGIDYSYLLNNLKL